jgi:thioredoxin reductase (NADPH)
MDHAPILTDDQLRRLRPIAKACHVAPGDVLYRPNDDTPAVYVVVSGALKISYISAGEELTFMTYGPGQFSGDLLMISGRRSIFRCAAVENGTLLEIAASDLRALIGRDAEFSEIFMNAFLARRGLLRVSGQGNVVILGSRHSPETLAIREFLTRDGHPFGYFDLETDAIAQGLLGRFELGPEDIPVVFCNGELLRNPTPSTIAEALGFNADLSRVKTKDLIVVGAGPAGLAAAVYAASEGLDTLVIEKLAPGGQAGSSSKIENYLGFPTGLSGQELAMRSIAQAEKFGARIMVARSVESLDWTRHPYKITLDDGQTLATRAIVLATGAQYNKPRISNLDAFSGRGIYYSATFMEAQLCVGERVMVIGGGNSAGQAAVFLAQNTAGVIMLVRGSGLANTMSRYLIQRIEENPNIHVNYDSELTGLEGDTHLEQVLWMDKNSGETRPESIRHIFVMTGASPQTRWLSDCLALDSKGFIYSGRDLEAANPPVPWSLSRDPYMLETSLPGVFVVGDARSGNVKRVASAVGEGSIVVHMVHQALAETETSQGIVAGPR